MLYIIVFRPRLHDGLYTLCVIRPRLGGITRMCVCVCVHVCVCLCTMYARTFICVYVCMYVCRYVYVYVYVCIYMYVGRYVYACGWGWGVCVRMHGVCDCVYVLCVSLNGSTSFCCKNAGAISCYHVLTFN